MPATSLPRRPQTLKQAKKAYRKAGAKARLSASELALIERRAVLQERADTLREREARRKANIKRKEERNERERESRLRMGISSPKKEGIAHVGPGQLDLGSFLGGVLKTNVKREEKMSEMETSSGSETDSEDDEEEKPVQHEPQVKPMGPPPRPPLQPVSSNRNLSNLASTSAANKRQITQENVVNESMDDDDFFVSNTQIERELSPPPKKTLPPPITPQIKSSLSMPPPPPLFAAPPLIQEEDPMDLLAQISTQDLDYTPALTQVQPQLPPPPQPRTPADSKTPSKEGSTSATTGETPLILHYSTQDFDFPSSPLQPSLSSQNPQEPQPSPSRQKSADSFDFEDDGITEGDLQDLAIELEMESSNEFTRTFTGDDEVKPDEEQKLWEDGGGRDEAVDEKEKGEPKEDVQTQESEYGSTQDLDDDMDDPFMYDEDEYVEPAWV